jgi:hypothetical protein
VIFKIFNNIQQAMDEVENKEISNTIPSTKTSREEGKEMFNVKQSPQAVSGTSCCANQQLASIQSQKVIPDP